MLFGAGKMAAQCSSWISTPVAKWTNDAPFTLSLGSPTPGVYFGAGVSGPPYIFNPAAAGAGSHQIGYSANSCSDTAYATFVVNASPTATLTGLDTAYCIDNSPQVITPTGTPSGGTLFGPGVTGGNFNIGTAGIGNHAVKYYFTNANNCTDTATAMVNVRVLGSSPTTKTGQIGK